MTMRGGIGGTSAIVGAALFAALGLAACADGIGPRRLDPADLSLVSETTQQTLEINKIGESANWSNPASGNRGKVTPTRTFQRDDGRPCRAFQQTATIDGRTRIAQDTACRTAAGMWQSESHSSLADAIRSDDAPAYGGSYGPSTGVSVGVGGGRSGVSVGTGIGF